MNKEASCKLYLYGVGTLAPPHFRRVAVPRAILLIGDRSAVSSELLLTISERIGDFEVNSTVEEAFRKVPSTAPGELPLWHL